ncbi:hypothetical protein Leryth_022817 [Lithospermum erythrorhizon]|nr:hypothetical protein Leryth_022817 [Lithospermum erythrorhizon]
MQGSKGHGYWKASHERPENRTPFSTQRSLEFLQSAISKEEEIEGVPEKIMNMCSFENLSKLEVNKSGKHMGGTPLEMDNNEMAGWRLRKNHLTQRDEKNILIKLWTTSYMILEMKNMLFKSSKNTKK